MPAGGGKYESEVTMIRESTRAKGVLLAVVDGDRGNGFSVQATPDVMPFIAQVLECVLDTIRKDGVTWVPLNGPPKCSSDGG